MKTSTNFRSCSVFTFAVALCACAPTVVDGSAEDADGDPTVAFADGTPIVGLAGKCVDVDHGLTDDGTKVQLWDCNGSPAQDWIERDGQLIGPGNKCLDVSGANASNGTLVQLWECNGLANQQWHFEGKAIVGLGGKCLDVPASNSENGTQLIIWDCHGGANQQWTHGTPPTDDDDSDPGQTGAWPNEPAGFVPVVDCPFSGNICNLQSYYNTSAFATDPTAPGSGPTVFDEFMAEGSAQGNGEWGINLNHPREIYVGTWWSTNADFVGYSNNNNKLLFARNYRDNNFLTWMGLPGQPKTIKWYMQATYDNCGHPGEYGMCYSQGDGTGWFEPNQAASGVVAAGSGWHRLEFYLKSSTTTTSRDGIVRWWVDGQLVGDYPTVNLTPDGFEDFVITSAWDGFIPCPTVRDCSKAWHHYWDDMRISVPAN